MTRQRFLFILLVAVGLGLLTYQVLWPSVIRPLFDVSDQIAKAMDDLNKNDDKLAAGERIIAKHVSYVERNGGTDTNKIRDNFRAGLNTLLAETNLRGGRISSPEPRVDTKTKIATLSFTVGAEGTLQQTVEFLRRFYELPYVTRIRTLSLTPQTGTGKDRGKTIDSLAMHTTLEVLVLPTHKLSPVKATVPQPEDVPPRHSNADYSLIWNRRPFSDWVPPPQGACCLGSQCVMATAEQCADQSGTYQGDNTRCEPNPCAPPPPPTGACCVTVDDTTSCSVISMAECVQIHGKYQGDHSRCEPNPCDKPAIVTTDPIDPGPGEVEIRDPQGSFKLVSAALSYGRDEVRVRNTQTQQHDYVKVGTPMDGGELILVHPYGAIVHRQDGDYMYPLGKTFAESALLAPREYPEVYLALKELRRQRAAADARAAEEAEDLVGPPYDGEPDSDGVAVAPQVEPQEPVAGQPVIESSGAPAEEQAFNEDMIRYFMSQVQAPTTYPSVPVEPTEDFVGPPYLPD